MKLRPNENVLRVALIVFSIIFGILSVSLIALGAAYADELWWPRRYVGLDFLELPKMLIVLGSLSLFMAFAGCFCAKSYNRKLLLTFGVVLVAILCLELTIAIIAFINFDEHEGENSKTHRIMLEQYNSNKEEDHIIFNEIEQHYKCCGVTGNEEKCKPDNSTTTNGPPAVREIAGCADTVNIDIRTIALESGYFSSVLSMLQAVEIGYVYLIRHLMDNQ